YAFGTDSTPLNLNNGCSSDIASNGAVVWVTSQCTQNAIELDASSGAILQDTVLEYSPVALSLDDSGDVWLANPYVGNAFSVANGNTGSYDGANDPNDQGTVTELSSPPPLVTSNTDTTQTQTFNYSPNVQTFTVPANVTQLTLNVNGAEGGRGGRDSAGRPPLGGYQGVVSGTIAVTPGEVLTIGVGHGGHDSSIAETCTEGLNSLFDPENAIGGSNPLGSYAGGNGGAAGEEGCSGYGGGGGAASVVEIGSSSNDPTSVATIVAGGSGGAGGSGQYPRTLGQVSLTSFEARSDVTSTDGQAGLSVYNACIGAPSCDGGGGAAGGGGVQGGAQGLVQFGSGESNEWFGLGGSPGANSTGALSGLSAQYEFYRGDGANGSVVISYPTGLPGIPTNVVVTPTASTVGVVWSPPSVIGSSALIDYMLRYSNDDGVTWTTQDLHSTSSSTTLALVGGASDVFEVAAVNQSGQGGWSVLASPPAAPTLTGITAGNEYVSVSFVAGANGGSPITGYQYSLDGGLTWHNTNGVASPTLISGLANGTPYNVELRAVNAAGTGGVSNTETATPFTVPSTPDATTFVTTSHDGQIGIAWSASNDDGSPVSEYTITLYDASFAGNQITTCDVSDLTCYDGNTTNVSGTYSISDCTLTSLSCTISGLTNYTTYWVSIQASNLAGASGRSSPLVPAIPALVSVAYDANGGTGAVSSSSYEVGLPGITLPTSGVTKPGYLLSGWSTVANDATTEVTSPYVPPSPVAPATTAYETLYALWTPATQYSVTYDGNGNTGGTAPVDAMSPYYADVDATVLGNTGALLDTGYLFSGWNTQANGQGTPYSAGATFDVLANTVLYAQWTPIQWLPPAPPIPLPSTPSATPPGIALDPSAVVTGSSGVITWGAPTSDGGSPVTGYTVTNANGVVVCSTTVVLSCAISNLVGKGPFVFTITASNAVGAGVGESFTAHVTALACGSAGAPKCATHSHTVVFGVVYFATGKYAIAGASHTTLMAIAKSVVAHHVRTLDVVGAADLRGSVAQNVALSMRRARSTVTALRTMFRSLHYALPRFIVKAQGVSTKYVGLSKNRRTTISGVITT
ncbi:MAG TPA: fibronectin type III domain-containing protein, partial [Acidimicrobiales bacterium]